MDGGHRDVLRTAGVRNVNGRRTLWFRTAAAVGAVALGLACAESLPRVHLGDRFAPGVAPPRAEAVVGRYDADLGWTLKPDLATHVVAAGFDYQVTTNSLGFRGPEPAIPKPSGTYRVLVLGDPFGWGWGVGDGEGFAELLRESGDGDVVNLSVPGYSTDQELWTLERHGERLAPDLVLLQFTANDLDGNETSNSHFMLKPYFQEDGRGARNLVGRPVPTFTGPVGTWEPAWHQRWLQRFALGKMLAGTIPPVSASSEIALAAMASAADRSAAMSQEGATHFALGRLARLCKDLDVPLLAFAAPPAATPEQFDGLSRISWENGAAGYLFPVSQWLLEEGRTLGFETF